jgi:hypothetical protein
VKIKNGLASAAALLVLSIALVAGPAAAKGFFTYDFTYTLNPWLAQTDGIPKAALLELKRNDNGCSAIAPAEAPDMPVGYANLRFAPNAKGTGAWITAKFPGYGYENVTVSWNARSTGNCKDCKHIVYAGNEMPTRASDFAEAATASLTSPPVVRTDWTHYTHMALVKADGTVFVAIGATGPIGSDNVPGILPNPYGNIGIDCVSITIVPAGPE